MTRDRTFPLRALALAIAALLALVAGCSAGSTSDSSGRGSLSVGLVAEPANLDFTQTDGAAIPQALLVNVYEGLVKLDQSGDIVPLLAKSWDISKDRKTYTFHLQKGVKFTSGDRFTADDVKFSIDRVKTQWKPSVKAAMNVVDKVTVLNDLTARVTLNKPSNTWLYKMGTRIGAMFSRTGVDHLATKPVGTGPFELKNWKRGDSITLIANPDYWGAKPKLDKVTLQYFKDPSALNNALLAGDIDVIGSVQAPESLKQFSDKSKYQIIEGTTTGEVVMAMNNAHPPLDDKRVRRAIRYAIDHEALLDTAWAGRGKLIGSMVPPSDPWYEDLTGMYPHNPKKAKKLLAASGHRKFTLNARIPNLPYAVSSAQVVKSQLAEVGITVKIQPLEFPAVWLDKVFNKHKYDLSIINHVEPRDIATVFGPGYYTEYHNPSVQKLFAKADRGTEKQQIKYMRKAARTISADAAADFLFCFPNLMVAKKGVKGLPKNVVSEAFDLTVLSKS